MTVTTTARRTITALALALTTALALVTQAQALKTGDLVATSLGCVGEGGCLFGVDPLIPAPHDTLLGDAANPAPTAGFARPTGVAFEPGGSMLVVQRDRLIRVNPHTGARTLVSGAGRGTGLEFSNAVAVAWGRGPNAAIVVADRDLDDGVSSGMTGAIFRVDPVTGNRRVVTGPDAGSGAVLAQIGFDLAALPGGDYMTIGIQGSTKLVRVDEVSGSRVAIGDGGGPDIVYDGGVATRDASSVYAAGRSGVDESAVVAVDLVTGTRTLVSGTAGVQSRGTGPALGVLGAVTTGADGALYVSSFSAGAIALLAVLRIDPSTGNRTLVDLAGSDPDVDWGLITGLAEVPAPPSLPDLPDRVAVVGQPFDLTIHSIPGSSGQVATSVIAQGLPPGLSATDLGDAVRISGIPRQALALIINVQARNDLHVAAAGFTLTTVHPSAGVENLHPGDLIATESSSGASLYSVDRAAGALTVITSAATPTPGGAHYSRTFASAFAADGTIVTVAGDEQDQVVRVDPRSGQRTRISGEGRGSGPALDKPVGVAIEPDGDIIVVDSYHYPESGFGGPQSGALFRVDPATGDRTIISSQLVGSGPLLCLPGQVIVDADGSYLVSEDDCAADDRADIMRIDPQTGARTLVWTGPAGARKTRAGLWGLARDPDGEIVAVDYEQRQVLRIDPATGNGSVVSAASTGAGADIGRPQSVAVAPDGTIYTGPISGLGAILRIDPASGDRAVVADSTTSNLAFSDLSHLLLAPPAPQFSGSDTLTFVKGQAAGADIATLPGVTGQHATEVRVAGELPPGLSATGAAQSAVITGTPTQTGEVTVVATLRNAAYTATRTYRIVVVDPPPVVVIDVPSAVAAAASVGDGRPGCRSAREVDINLMPPRGTKLTRTVVTVAGARVRTLGRGVTRLRLSFAGRPPSQVRVDLRATTTRGVTLVGRRTYRLCAFTGVRRIPLKPLGRARSARPGR